jgi:hypothetical protein
MGTQGEKELNQRIDEVLPYLRDPIGVAGIPLAGDEYQSYVPKLCATRRKCKAIADSLSEIITKRMRILKNAGATLHVVAVLQARDRH